MGLEKADIESWIAERFGGDEDFFLVTCEVRNGDEVLVEVDRMSGITSDECASICRELSDYLDAQGLDVSLTVSSPGLTSPLRVPQQFEKNLGQMVEVLRRDGLKSQGILQSYDEKGLTIVVSEKKRLEGEKRPRMVEREEYWDYESVKHVKLILAKR